MPKISTGGSFFCPDNPRTHRTSSYRIIRTADDMFFRHIRRCRILGIQLRIGHGSFSNKDIRQLVYRSQIPADFVKIYDIVPIQVTVTPQAGEPYTFISLFKSSVVRFIQIKYIRPLQISKLTKHFHSIITSIVKGIVAFIPSYTIKSTTGSRKIRIFRFILKLRTPCRTYIAVRIVESIDRPLREGNHTLRPRSISIRTVLCAFLTNMQHTVFCVYKVFP